MKKLTFLAAALVVATLFSAQSAFADLTETIDRTFDVRPGAKVSLRNVNGSVTISSWDQPRVRVVAEKRVEGSRKESQAAMKELRVELQPRDGGLAIITHYPKEEHG